ncbi:MAG TPA: aminotransferase class V-fold PLP-dependent enzyme [Candidatus Acidoferrales bacterium]|nr:aminotransferase class V-fold PLP-dependent enzyme [Candidatus Acidoferrales bacterium]
MNELLSWRPEFPILETSTYLISNSLGAMPRAVRERMAAYTESWAVRGVRAWEEEWWTIAGEVGDKIGRVIGAPPGSVSVHQNVTLTQAAIASCYDYNLVRAGGGGPRNKIVLVDLEFPSILYFYQEQRRYGADVMVVPSDDGIHPPIERILDAIDERTLLVPISQVLFRSAAIVDARAIVEKAQRVGAHVVLDVFQAAGTFPVDVTALGVEYCVGGVLKWLCGGPGVGYLYVRPDLAPKLNPAITGWFAHKSPFAFDPRPIERTDSGYRFLTGTTQVPALYAAGPGLDIIAAAGVENIRRKSMALTAHLIAGAQARGWRVNTPLDPAARAGTVSIDCPHAQDVAHELVARNILVDYRPKAGVRISPHFYNRQEELDRALDAISEIVAARGAAAGQPVTR